MENNEPNFIVNVDQPEPKNVPAQKSGHVFSNIDLSKDNQTAFNIKIIGIGGAGCNVINHIAANHKNITDAASIYAFNTDLCSLKLMKNVNNIFLLNKDELKGYGSGGNPEIGKAAVQKDAEVIKQELTGTDILFIIAGMGKGAGSGGAPELAQIAKDLGILTLSIVNMPSVVCEGEAIYNNAFNALQSLLAYSDSVSTISNEKIISNNKDISFYDAYQLANEEIANIIEDIMNIMFKPTVMNVDFADLKSFFKQNKFFMSNRLTLEQVNASEVTIREAINQKIKRSCSDVNISECKKIIANISMSKDTPTTFLADVNHAFREITKNDKLSLLAGINYNDDKKIDISFLIAGKSFSGNFENAFSASSDDETSWSDPTIKVEAAVEPEANEYDNLIKSVEAAATPTEDVLAQTDTSNIKK